MNLIERAKNMIFTPKLEWEIVVLEPSSPAELYKGYIIPLAALGPIATFIGLSFVGVPLPFMGAAHISVMAALSMALVSYLFALLGIFIIALLISALAPTFGGEKNQTQALKVAAFSYTPAWVAGVLHVIPSLGVLVLLAAFYSWYVLYLGLPVVMKAPREKAVGYAITVIVCAIVISLVFGVVAGTIGSFGMWPRHMNGNLSHGGNVHVSFHSHVDQPIDKPAAMKA